MDQGGRLLPSAVTEEDVRDLAASITLVVERLCDALPGELRYLEESLCELHACAAILQEKLRREEVLRKDLSVIVSNASSLGGIDHDGHAALPESSLR